MLRIIVLGSKLTNKIAWRIIKNYKIVENLVIIMPEKVKFPLNDLTAKISKTSCLNQIYRQNKNFLELTVILKP